MIRRFGRAPHLWWLSFCLAPAALAEIAHLWWTSCLHLQGLIAEAQRVLQFTICWLFSLANRRQQCHPLLRRTYLLCIARFVTIENIGSGSAPQYLPVTTIYVSCELPFSYRACTALSVWRASHELVTTAQVLGVTAAPLDERPMPGTLHRSPPNQWINVAASTRSIVL